MARALTTAALALVTACSAAPPSPAPPALPALSRDARFEAPLLAGRWVARDAQRSLELARSDGSFVLLVTHRRVGVDAQGLLRVAAASEVDATLERLVEVPTARGPVIVGCTNDRAFRFSDPLGPPTGAIVSARQGLFHCGSGPSALAIDVGGNGMRFVDVDTGADVAVALPPFRATEAAFEDPRRGAALLPQLGFAVTTDAGHSWSIARQVAPAKFGEYARPSTFRGEIRLAHAEDRVDPDAAALIAGDAPPGISAAALLVAAVGLPELAAPEEAVVLPDGQLAFAAYGALLVYDPKERRFAERPLAAVGRQTRCRALQSAGGEAPARALFLCAAAHAPSGAMNLQIAVFEARLHAGRAGLDAIDVGPAEARAASDAHVALSPTGALSVVAKDAVGCAVDGAPAWGCTRDPAGRWSKFAKVKSVWPPSAGALADGRLALLGYRKIDGKTRPGLIVVAADGGAVEQPPTPAFEPSDVVGAVEEIAPASVRFVLAADDDVALVTQALGAEPVVRKLDGFSRLWMHDRFGLGLKAGVIATSTDGGATWTPHEGSREAPDAARVTVAVAGVKVEEDLAHFGWVGDAAPAQEPAPTPAPTGGRTLAVKASGWHSDALEISFMLDCTAGRPTGKTLPNLRDDAVLRAALAPGGTAGDLQVRGALFGLGYGGLSLERPAPAAPAARWVLSWIDPVEIGAARRVAYVAAPKTSAARIELTGVVVRGEHALFEVRAGDDALWAVVRGPSTVDVARADAAWGDVLGAALGDDGRVAVETTRAIVVWSAGAPPAAARSLGAPFTTYPAAPAGSSLTVLVGDKVQSFALAAPGATPPTLPLAGWTAVAPANDPLCSGPATGPVFSVEKAARGAIEAADRAFSLLPTADLEVRPGGACVRRFAGTAEDSTFTLPDQPGPQGPAFAFVRGDVAAGRYEAALDDGTLVELRCKQPPTRPARSTRHR